MQIIIEVGSTNTKIDLYDNGYLTRLEEITIPFKTNYIKMNVLDKKLIEILINKVNYYKNVYQNVFIGGTSIFRTLEDSDKKSFLKTFKKNTGLSFHIISQSDENKYTIYGAKPEKLNNYAILIGGGGSIELSIFENENIKTYHYTFGVIDILNKFPDLKNDLAQTSYAEVTVYIRKRIEDIRRKSHMLILAGGAHQYFALNSGFHYEQNLLYEDKNAPIMMSREIRKQDTEKYFREISLENIKKVTSNPEWWNATRPMCALVMVIAEMLEVEYIVPTDIGMSYGIIKERM